MYGIPNLNKLYNLLNKCIHLYYTLIKFDTGSFNFKESTLQGTGKDRDAKGQFYTKRAIAEFCVKKCIDPLSWVSHTNTLGIEPSAGAGALLNIHRGETIALDMEPKVEGVLAADFLSWECACSQERPSIFFGNSPFGRQGSIAKKFL